MFILKLFILFKIFWIISGEDINNNNNADGTSCVNHFGQPQICYPPFENYASAGLKVIATNTCGLRGRQKYCIGLSTAEMRSRCDYCDNRNVSERHSADYLTDQNPNNWWQSETVADNRDLFNKQSINLTLNLGKQFHVTFIHLQFKSPRPSAMILYRKYNDASPWQAWQYFASNCLKFFNMPVKRGYNFQSHDEVLCTEDFSSLNQFYNGIVMFATIHGRPGSENFFSNKKMMDWATASQIRIEMKKMHTFGEQNDEEELLLTFFYAIKSLQVAARCWCNGHGNECRKSTGEGLEPKLYCVCHPSHHTTGQSCDLCDSFYQDRPWKAATPHDANICQRCNCNENSDSCVFDEELYIRSGNVSGGRCLNCKGNTKGPHCDECIEGYFKNPAQPNRCLPCNCNSIGRVLVQCDDNGICACQPGVEGEKCTRCKNDHFNFGPRGCQPCNCHLPGVNTTNGLYCNPADGICYCKKNVMGEKCDQCVGGFFSLNSNDPLGCRPCFCFSHTKECTMASGFLLTEFDSEFEGIDDNWKYGVGIQQPKLNPMLDLSIKPPAITWFIERDPWRDDYYLYAPKKFLGDRRLSYNLYLILTLSFKIRPDYKSYSRKWISMINDVQLISDTLFVSVPFDIGENPFPEPGNGPMTYKFRLNEESGLWRDKIDYLRFNSILSNLLAIKIRLSNPHGYVKLHKAVLQTALDGDLVKSLNLSLPMATSVEKCSCPPQYTGLSCENCAPGFHREYSVGTEFLKCIKCMCNNQSDSCHAKTGACDCEYNTIGHMCEKCVSGFYGDPTTQIKGVCKPCGCPGGTACELVSNNVVCTECPDNLGGYRCDRCRDNYYGNPKLNITCQSCNCFGNIDYFSTCDSISGKCSNCLFNSDGDNCESCKPGYYLQPNERAPYRCKRCVCNPFGSWLNGNVCNVYNGDCYCKPKVIGKKCDECEPGFFNLTDAQECQSCNCYPLGTLNQTCNQISGQCHCKPGVTGLRCDQCEYGFYNLSVDGCQNCLCDSVGSTNLQCDLNTGQCSCKPNVIGMNCNQCLENHFNLTSSGCQPCGPCYHLIQKRLNRLKFNISTLLNPDLFDNYTDLNYMNDSNIIVIQSYQKVVTDILNNMTNYLTNDLGDLKDIRNKLESLNKTMYNLEEELKYFKSPDKDKKMKEIIKDIKNLENEIINSYNKDFKEHFQSLQKYIQNKNENNEKVTKMAELAHNYQSNTSKRKEELENLFFESEKLLNNFVKDFEDMKKQFSLYEKSASQLNFTQLEEFSTSVNGESMKNLIKIYEYKMKLASHKENSSKTERKLDFFSKQLDEFLKYFEDEYNKIDSTMTLMRAKLINFTREVLENLEKEQKSANDTNLFLRKASIFSRANNLLKNLEEGKSNLTNAIKKANETLNILQESDKNFNEVVNQSKQKADEQIKRIPYLKGTLTNIKAEINTLNKSYNDIVSDMKENDKDMKKLENESVVLYFNSQNQSRQVQNLLNETGKLQEIEEIKMQSDKKYKDDLTTLDQFFNLSKEIGQSENLLKKQKDSRIDLESKMEAILKQLLSLNNDSKSINENSLRIYSKMVNELSENVENYFKNEYRTVAGNLDNLNQEWNELQIELELADKEINRLELINKHMVETNVCYKAGGKAEGQNSF